MIKPQFNYCPLIWMFCSKKSNKLIKTQVLMIDLFKKRETLPKQYIYIYIIYIYKQCYITIFNKLHFRGF